MSITGLDALDSERIELKKKNEAVDIHFEDVSYSVKKRGLDFWNSEEKAILNEVSGDFQSRKLTGIIGPSGCGKTTLLNVISGYRLRGVSGYVYVNGRERNIKKLIRQSCYIMQDDKLQPLITVHEAMTFVSNVKLEITVKKAEKQSKVDEILTNFSLQTCRDSLIKNLSGGERRRLAVALELISNPPVLFLDEPTSGLDSKAARQCLEVLQRLAEEGRTVICTIHQPSSLLLNMFNNIYVLSNGYCIYQGTTDNLLSFLSLNQFECPIYYNPVEYIVEVCALGSEDCMMTLKNAINNGRIQEWLDSPACWSSIPLSSTMNIESNQQYELEDHFHYATSFRSQLYYLLERTFKISMRNQYLTRLKLSLNIGIGLILGLFFRDIGNDAGQVFVNFNLLFFCLLSVMFNAITSKIITFPNDLPVIKREYFNCWYSLKAYFLSAVIGDMPIQAISTTIFSVLVYVLTGQPLQWYRICQFLIIIVLTALLFQDYGILVGTLLNIQNGLIFGLFSISPWVMFSGFFLYYRDTPVYFQWLYKISVLRHALEALSISVYGYGREEMKCYKDSCRFTEPDMFLKHVDIDGDKYPVNLIYISFLYILVKVCCYLVIKYKFRS